jgi:uncharacterized protein with PQ loop repeat
MLNGFAPYIGGISALFASLSYIAQVRKYGRAGPCDLSLGMLPTLATGLALWVLSMARCRRLGDHRGQ